MKTQTSKRPANLSLAPMAPLATAPAVAAMNGSSGCRPTNLLSGVPVTSARSRSWYDSSATEPHAKGAKGAKETESVAFEPNYRIVAEETRVERSVQGLPLRPLRPSREDCSASFRRSERRKQRQAFGHFNGAPFADRQATILPLPSWPAIASERRRLGEGRGEGDLFLNARRHSKCGAASQNSEIKNALSPRWAA